MDRRGAHFAACAAVLVLTHAVACSGDLAPPASAPADRPGEAAPPGGATIVSTPEPGGAPTGGGAVAPSAAAASPTPPAMAEAPARARELCAAGWTAFGRGDRESARRSLDEAIELLGAPTEPAAQRTLGACLYNRGRVAEADGDPADARSFYERSLAVRPNATVSARLAALPAVAPAPPPADAAALAAFAEICGGVPELERTAHSPVGPLEAAVVRCNYDSYLAARSAADVSWTVGPRVGGASVSDLAFEQIVPGGRSELRFELEESTVGGLFCGCLPSIVVAATGVCTLATDDGLDCALVAHRYESIVGLLESSVNVCAPGPDTTWTASVSFAEGRVVVVAASAPNSPLARGPCGAANGALVRELDTAGPGDELSCITAAMIEAADLAIQDAPCEESEGYLEEMEEMDLDEDLERGADDPSGGAEH